MKKLFEILFGIYYVSTIYFFIFLFFIANKETKNIVIIIITVLIISCISFRLVNYILENNTDKEYKDKIKIKFFQDVERIKEGFNRNSNIIIFLTISLIFSYCIWKQIPLIFTIKDDFKSIGENLFFNFLFIGITVFTIDYMKEKIKEQEEKPIKEAVYNRIAKIFEKFNFLCIEMCRYSNVEKEIQNIEELYKVENFEKIFENLDLECIPKFLDTVNWRNFIKNIYYFMENEWKLLISLYYLIKPELYNQIDNLFEKSNLLNMMRDIEDRKIVVDWNSKNSSDTSYNPKKLYRYYYLYKDIEISKINKQTLEKELKEILDVLKNFNKEYKKEWNREIKLSYSETEVECIDKNQEEV